MNETYVTVTGNLTADPELKYSPTGQPLASFTVASTPRTFDKASGEWKDRDTTFYRCTAWRQQAENIAETCTRGMRVIVSGTLSVREFEGRDGTRGKSVEINVFEMGPSLRSASARVTKTSRSGGGDRGPVGDEARWSPGPAETPADPWQGDEPPF